MKPQIDKRWVAASFSKAAQSYDAVASLQQDIARTSLALILEPEARFQRVADIGCGTGLSTQLLSQALQPEALTAVDIAEGMLAACARRALPNTSYVCADAEALPLFAQSFNLVFSNFALQWCPSIETAFSNIQQNLARNGKFVFSIPGAGSLLELKQAWAQVDTAVHVNEFYAEDEIQQALVSAGFSDVKVQLEERVLYYPSPMDLMRELKSLGAHNVHAGRNVGLTGKQHFVQMLQAYDGFKQKQGVPATWRVLIGVAVK